MINGHHAKRTALHVERHGFFVELAFNGDDGVPRFWIKLIKVFECVFLKDPFDVDYVLLDLQIVRSTTQSDEGSGDYVHETPGEFTECCRVTFAGELPSDPGGDLRNSAKSPNGVVACRVIRPAQVEHIKFVQSAGAFGFEIHALEQIGIALRIEDDNDLVLAVFFSPDVLGDEQLSQACFSYTCGAKNQ
ncbi:hypothetical protein BV338_05635 [Pseudomonas syringae pv. actinidiae]|nr:hypothetical protein BV342_05679 [Pseudomonas syringae pv. actinidiae]OSN63467.1 hypothetical protein BV350_05494 [Pseudomonas syringae pv. actinidiae]OSS26337.1 hypothetical protein BV338_05635 [Pseudomonas syringae pv. actinidiae]RMP80717.1 hypothetical protein ALQ16_200413 [Pseudomonas syringae pv. actinidiae]